MFALQAFDPSALVLRGAEGESVSRRAWTLFCLDSDSLPVTTSIISFIDVHGGGEMATGLLNIRIRVTSSDLSSATAAAYQLFRDSIAKSQIEVEIRNQSAFAV